MVIWYHTVPCNNSTLWSTSHKYFHSVELVHQHWSQHQQEHKYKNVILVPPWFWWAIYVQWDNFNFYSLAKLSGPIRAIVVKPCRQLLHVYSWEATPTCMGASCSPIVKLKVMGGRPPIGCASHVTTNTKASMIIQSQGGVLYSKSCNCK